MLHSYEDHTTHAFLRLGLGEDHYQAGYLEGPRRTLTFFWNRGEDRLIEVDGVSRPLPCHAVLPLMTNQAYRLAGAAEVVAWSFNRDFYCIIDHDAEVSCVGLLFYGVQDPLVLLPPAAVGQLEALTQVFVDEFQTQDTIQGEMLRVLLKRLIITLTRQLKAQLLVAGSPPDGPELGIIRQFNLLVENHYRRKHRVADYADLLHRSPKTLANLSAAYNQKSPLQVIHARLATEAKRLLRYTNKSAKEIAYELGFEDAGHFSRFFKNQVGVAPSHFQPPPRTAAAGQ
ncbi:MAG: helix-turn-helix domain-containing protein [Hymenobacter sp.]|nr:helix-turn-helix domain-containing protein [Hymenobacter sp.]